MKKINIFLMVLLLLCACSKSDDNDAPEYDTPAAEAAKGIYKGIYSRVAANSTDTLYQEGIINLYPRAVYDSIIGDTILQETVAVLKFESTPFSLNANITVNISHRNDAFVFSNHVSSNELGNPFFGSIDEEGVIKTSFALSQRVGRKTSIFYYDFVGLKIDSTIDK